MIAGSTRCLDSLPRGPRATGGGEAAVECAVAYPPLPRLQQTVRGPTRTGRRLGAPLASLLRWQEAALRCSPQALSRLDAWLRRARLHLVANPSHILLLLRAGCTPRLASRGLRLILCCLAANRRSSIGQPLVHGISFVSACWNSDCFV